MRVFAVGCCGLAAAGGSCKQPFGELIPIAETLGPYERLPYVQAVDSVSAVVQWAAVDTVLDRFEYRRSADSAWHALPVARDSAARFEGDNGTIAHRSVRVTGLRAEEEVEYRTWAGTAVAGPFRFRTAPAISPDTLRVLAFGDSGWGSPEQFQLARLMEERSWDLAVHTGDIAYDDGTEEDFTRRHFAVYRTLLARIPLFPSPGNHDLRAPGGERYRYAFTWDAPEPGARFYSFRWGNVLFIALDTTNRGPDYPDLEVIEASGLPGDESDGEQLRDRRGRQYEWLFQTLADSEIDPTIRWTVLFMHHPPYSHATGFSGHGADVRLRRAIGPLIDRFGVDVVISGHDHHYERTHPLRDDRRVNEGCGPTYFVTGGGGASIFARGIARTDYLGFASRAKHFLQIEIYPSGMQVLAINERDRVLDQVRLYPYEGLDAEGEAREPICS